MEIPILDKIIDIQRSLDHMGLQAGQRILEIGPGAGRLLIPAAKRVLPGGEAVGLEIQAAMIERLQKRAAQAGVSNLSMIWGDASQCPILSESFDMIYLSLVLGEITDREAALRQCYHALKAGGLLSITELFLDPHYQRRRTVRRFAEAAGFISDRQYGNWFVFTMNFVKPSEENFYG